MRLAAVFGVLALSLVAVPRPASAQRPPDGGATARQIGEQVRVTARVIVVDREAFTRAGLSYAVVGNDRVRVTSTRRGSGGGVRVKVGTHPVSAFLEAVRESRWVRSESTQQVLTMSGRPALVSSMDLAVGRHAARSRGPSLAVVPTVLGDGTVHLQVSTGVEDRVTYAWGYGVDGSPAAVDTEILALDGEEVILASGSSTTRTRESGLLTWGGGEESRDVLVAVTADVLPR